MEGRNVTASHIRTTSTAGGHQVGAPRLGAATTTSIWRMWQLALLYLTAGITATAKTVGSDCPYVNVSGAGEAGVNGLYTLSGQLNDRGRWTSESGAVLQYNTAAEADGWFGAGTGAIFALIDHSHKYVIKGADRLPSAPLDGWAARSSKVKKPAPVRARTLPACHSFSRCALRSHSPDACVPHAQTLACAALPPSCTRARVTGSGFPFASGSLLTRQAVRSHCPGDWGDTPARVRAHVHTHTRTRTTPWSSWRAEREGEGEREREREGGNGEITRMRVSNLTTSPRCSPHARWQPTARSNAPTGSSVNVVTYTLPLQDAAATTQGHATLEWVTAAAAKGLGARAAAWGLLAPEALSGQPKHHFLADDVQPLCNTHSSRRRRASVCCLAFLHR